MPRAALAAAEIKKALGIEAELIKGSGGIFEVKAAGRVIFSRHDTGRFPEEGELVKLLEAAGKSGA